ncbi:uncharacterized protein LOC120334045 [Styela clava]
MWRLMLPAILATLLPGIGAVSISDLPRQVVETVGGSVVIPGTLFNATNSTLSWVKGDTYLVNATIRVYKKTASITSVSHLNRSLYEASFVAVGGHVNTNLTLKQFSMSLNQTKYKLKAGIVESGGTTMLIVKDNIEATTASGSDPMTSPDTMAPTDSMTSPDTIAPPDSMTSSVESSTSSPPQSNQTTPSITTSPTASSASEGGTAGGVSPCSGPGSPPSGESCTEVGCVVPMKDQNSTTAFKGSGRICTIAYTCNANGTWTSVESDCKCSVPGTWGPNCTRACSNGCSETNWTRNCDQETGKCLMTNGEAQTDCEDGYEGENCEIPVCEDCNGGECLRPGFCGNCPLHYEHGPTCRNIRLDGFTKGSIPSLVILAAVVIVLTIVSRWHIRRKIKEA